MTLTACHPRRLRARPAGDAGGPRGPRRSRIIEALTRAREWRRLIDTGEVKHAAALARSRLDVVPGVLSS